MKKAWALYRRARGKSKGGGGKGKGSSRSSSKSRSSGGGGGGRKTIVVPLVKLAFFLYMAKVLSLTDIVTFFEQLFRALVSRDASQLNAAKATVAQWAEHIQDWDTVITAGTGAVAYYLIVGLVKAGIKWARAYGVRIPSTMTLFKLGPVRITLLGR